MDIYLVQEDGKIMLKAGCIIIAVVDMDKKEVKVSDDWCRSQGLTLLVGKQFDDGMKPFSKKLTCNQCSCVIDSSIEERMVSTFRERNFDGSPDPKTHDNDVVTLQRCPKCDSIIGDLGEVPDIEILYKDLKTEMEG
jgi:hypothetical protein